MLSTGMLQSPVFHVKLVCRFYMLLLQYVVPLVDLVSLNLLGSQYLVYFSFVRKGKYPVNSVSINPWPKSGLCHWVYFNHEGLLCLFNAVMCFYFVIVNRNHIKLHVLSDVTWDTLSVYLFISSFRETCSSICSSVYPPYI